MSPLILVIEGEEVVVSEWIDAYRASAGSERRRIGTRLRELASAYPLLADELPDDVYNNVYRVRAIGTIAPDNKKDQ